MTLIPEETLFRAADISATAQEALERISHKRIRAAQRDARTISSKKKDFSWPR